MDLGSVVGLVMIVALLMMAMMMGVGLEPYLDVPSVLIVLGGASASILVSFKLEQLKGLGRVVGLVFKPQTYDIASLIKKLVNYSTIARRDGILALETPANQEDNLFMKKGLSMAVDGNEPDVIRSLLELETDATSDRHKSNAAMLDQFASLAGSYGMIGTLIGLVAMLVNMSDPSAIGPAMAVAIITTLYGAIFGNVVAAPMAYLLGIRNGDEIMMRNLIIEGIMSIQAGDNPRILEQKLLGFLPPNQRISQFE
ncbi:MAG: MotA/TolQ/ExbB proton channel family protein [Helicobacteraceae bacterium]|jgi:chemotaxis protein MotA|nr:MotA/TolQ/ExbB proton channel family protein [Helicobacteraceae bacterium]